MNVPKSTPTATANADWSELNRRLDQARHAISKLLEPGESDQEQILKERALKLARLPALGAAAQESRHELSVLRFDIAGERYAFETIYVAKVLPVSDITPIPGLPNFIVGIVAMQGDLLAVNDLRMLLDLPLANLKEPAGIIVLKNETMECGILADEIVGISRIASNTIDWSVPSLVSCAELYVSGVSQCRTAILDAQRLLSDPRLVIDNI